MRYPHESRALIVLAALKLRPSELLELHRFLADASPMAFVEIMRSLEREIFSSKQRHLIDFVEREETSPRTPNDDVVTQIIFLLRGQASFSNPEIAKGITSQLRKEKIHKNIPPYDPKKGIANWLEIVSSQVGPSRLLHLATLLRNNRAHTGKSPVWNLDER